MVQQGRILAAALAERGAARRRRTPSASCARLAPAVEARLRVHRPGRLGDRRLRACSARGEPAAEPRGVPREPRRARRAATTRSTGSAPGSTGVYRASWFAAGGAGRRSPSRSTPPCRRDIAPDAEVREALAGRYGAATRIRPGQRSVTLYSAIPVRDGGQVVGAVLVSQSTLRLFRRPLPDAARHLPGLLASVAVAAVLSLLVSTTIVRPLRRLRDEAHALLDRPRPAAPAASAARGGATRSATWRAPSRS